MTINNIDKQQKKEIMNKAIVYSQIKIQRNLEEYPFVSLLTGEKKKKLENEIIDFVKNWDDENEVYNLTELKPIEQNYLIDEGIISKDFTSSKENKFIIFPQGKISVLLNYIDHLTFSIISDEISLNDLYTKITTIENKFGRHYSYAASTRYGYLTAFIKDCGLALKVSSVLFLPGIFLQNRFEEIQKTYLERGYLIKLWNYFDETKETGYYTVSSNLNFGLSEEQLIKRFSSGLLNLIEYDHNELLKYYNQNKFNLMDKIFRSFGLLKYAVKMNYTEAFENISNLRLGIELGENIETSIEVLNKLFIKIKDGTVDKIAEDKKMDKDIIRANIIKGFLNYGRNDV